MKKSLIILGTSLAAILVIAAGGAAPSKSDSATLQGTWKGTAVTPQEPGEAILIVSGTNLDFRGANPNDWYKATFTLREDLNPKQLIAVVSACGAPQYIGKTANAIYRLEGKSLRLAGDEPGNPNIPASFDAPGTRQFLFQPTAP